MNQSVLRTWGVGDPEPPLGVDVLTDGSGSEHLPYLCRLPASPHEWYWCMMPKDRYHVEEVGVSWSDAVAQAVDLTVTEVLG